MAREKNELPLAEFAAQAARAQGASALTAVQIEQAIGAGAAGIAHAAAIAERAGHDHEVLSALLWASVRGIAPQAHAHECEHCGALWGCPHTSLPRCPECNARSMCPLPSGEPGFGKTYSPPRFEAAPAPEPDITDRVTLAGSPLDEEASAMLDAAPPSVVISALIEAAAQAIEKAADVAEADGWGVAADLRDSVRILRKGAVAARERGDAPRDEGCSVCGAYTGLCEDHEMPDGPR